MGQIDSAVAKLRLFLAELNNKEIHLDAQLRQFRQQMNRAPQQAIYARLPLEASLNVMSEVQERLDRIEMERKHLLMIKERANRELEALQLTRQVEDAKDTLAKLQSLRSKEGETVSKIQALEQFINDYSQRAAKAITDLAQRRASEQEPGH